MNRKAKGRRARREVITLLESQGYIVDIVEKTSRFFKQKDCFGLFDLVAIKDNLNAEFIQVTCNKPHTHKAYIDFAQKHQGVTVIQFVKIDRKGMKKYTYNQGGHVRKKDEGTNGC